MPIIKKEHIDKETAWAIWHIDESADRLEELLPGIEKEQLADQRITNLKRKEEWMAGRLVTEALTRFMGQEYTGIVKDEHGKPFLADQCLHINLSHSYPYAVAVASRSQTVGIDIEQVREKLARLCPKFLSEQELAHANDHLPTLCLYWTAKETLYKLYGKRKLIFKENILIEPFDLAEKGSLKGALVLENIRKPYTLYYHRVKNFYISFCISQ